MRILRINLFLFITIFGIKAFAQINISTKEVVKIHLVDGAGYLGGFYRNDYDLLYEEGQWKCYQTREQFRRYNHKIRDPKKMWEQQDSTEHKLVKIMDEDSINVLLKTIRVIKTKFRPADLKVSITKLTEQIDTAYLKNLDEKKVKLFNSFFDTPAKLYHLLDTMQHDSWTDDYPYSVIEIIKKGGDTVKLITNRQVDYMLPWRINEVATYDVKINEFFMMATGLKDHRMSGKYLSSRLYSCVDFLYARDALERLRWQESQADNLNFIRQHFDILKISRSNDYSSYSFHPKNSDNHIVISGGLNIANKGQLMALTKFAEDTIRKFLKSGGFMIDSCRAKTNCKIIFANNYGQANHHYFKMYQNGMDEYFKKYRLEDLLPFTIKSGERIEDNWVALPDGKFVLTAYIDDYAVGIPPKFIKKDGLQRRKFVFMIFASSGNLIFEGQ